MFRKGNDDVRGDSKAIPDRGTGTGLNGGDAHGADCSPDATNSHGGMGRATNSDHPDACVGKAEKL